MSIGMTYDQYWDGTPELTRFFRKAHEMKIKQKNEEAWLQGLYYYDALCSALSHFGENPKEYTNKPYSPETNKENEEARRLEAEAQAEVWLNSWVSTTQRMFKDEEPEPPSQSLS